MPQWPGGGAYAAGIPWRENWQGAAESGGKPEVHVEAHEQYETEGAGGHKPEARTIMVQPFDPSVTGDIERAIRKMATSLNPVSDGKVIRLPIGADRRAESPIRKGH